MAARASGDQGKEDDDERKQSTDKSKLASLREQKMNQLRKALNAAASQAEKERAFREYLVNRPILEDCKQNTDESKIATYLSLRQETEKLSKALNAAASQEEKEKVFREYLVCSSDKKGGFLRSTEEERQENLEDFCFNRYYTVVSTLAQKHGCMYIMNEWSIKTMLNQMQPGSGLRLQPLTEIMCANCTLKTGSQGHPGVAECEKLGTMVCSGCHLVKYCSKRCQKQHWPAHKVDCKSLYAKEDWLKGSMYEMTAEDASAKRMPLIVGQRFRSKAVNFSSSAMSLPTPCSAVLAESGDLSDMVHTILSVPDEYEGEITLHINHPSPHIAFCNLLSLLAMGSLGELSCDMLIQLWYSVAMTSEQMQNIIKMIGGDLITGSKGAVIKSQYCASLPKLPLVMLKVNLQRHLVDPYTTGCTLQSTRCIGMCMEDRYKHIIRPEGKRYAVEMLTTLSSHQRVSWDKYARLGMLLPLGALNADHNLPNPFLFDVDNHWRPERQLDPLQCWSRDEIIAAGQECGVPSNDIYGALFFLIRQKISACIQKLSKLRFHIIVTCCEPSALVHQLHKSKTAMHYITGVDATQLQYTHSDNQELSALSVRTLKEIIQGAGLSLEGCLEKSDLVARAALIRGCAAPLDDKDFTAVDTTSPPTQQQQQQQQQQQPDEASKVIRFIEARASLDPPDILAICYLAKLDKMEWMKKGAEKSIPECLALYGWYQLCFPVRVNAWSGLSHLQQAKDMKNANGLLYWGLVMESVYGHATNMHSEAWNCYHESACLGNHDGMFNVAHVLAARGDYPQAVGWWKQAEHHGPSLFELYHCYLDGRGCTKDDLEAKKYLQQAADEGYGPACAALSEWYSTGWENVLRKNPKKQAHWLKQATISSEKHPVHIIKIHPLRSLLETKNATPCWWKCLGAVVQLMEPNAGIRSEGTMSAEIGNRLDIVKFASEAVEKFMNSTLSNGGGMSDFGLTSLHDPFLQSAENLALTSEKQLHLQGIVQEIRDILTSSRVIASVEVCGSYGKGTAVSGCVDLDIVAMTVKCFESDMYLSLQHHVATLLKNNLKVELKYKPLAVSFTYKHVEIDVVVASPNIEPISQCFLPPRPRYFRRPSLSVQECAFLRSQPHLFGAVVRLLKKWRASAENWPYGCKPRSFLLELIALAAIQKVGTSFTEETVRNGFVTSLELLLQVISGDLRLYWVDNYPDYSIQFENYDGPIVMDPFDPTNNLAGLLQIQDWHPLSQLAEQTLIAIRDLNIVQRVIHITPTSEKRVSSIASSYRFSCRVLRAEQLMTAGNVEEALEALAAASQIDSSNKKLLCMWLDCIKLVFAEECEAKKSSLTEVELLSKLKDGDVDSVQVSVLGKEMKKSSAQSEKAPNFFSKDKFACEEMDIPFSTYMRLHDEIDSNSSEEEDIPWVRKLFPEASEDELCTPISKVIWKSNFKDGMYRAFLILRDMTNKMPSKEQQDMYTSASLQSVLAHDAFLVGKNVIGLDRMTASILAPAETMNLPGLNALALTAAKQVKREASSEMQVLPHCGLTLLLAASIVHVHIHVMRQAWDKASEALKPLLEQDDLQNRADVCYFMGSRLSWTKDYEKAMLWFERGIKADPTFHLNLGALGCTMIYAKSTVEADPELTSVILQTAERHLWQYIEQGVPEDNKRSDVMYELVLVAFKLKKFQEACIRLEMAIEADIRHTQIYHQPCASGTKQNLMMIATVVERIRKVIGVMQKDDSEAIFFNTLQTKLCRNPLLITDDIATKLENVTSIGQTMKDFMSQKLALSFWSVDKSETEYVHNLLKNLTRSEEKNDSVPVASDDGVNKAHGQNLKGMQQIVVDCEGSGDFLSLAEALSSGCVAMETVISMKGGTYKEHRGLCIEHEHLTIQAASSKEKVVIQSYGGIQVKANHVTLSGLSVDLLSPKGYDGVTDLGGHAIHVRAGTAVMLENCSATSATGAAIYIGDRVGSGDIEVTMVLCNARSSVSDAILCSGLHTRLQLQQCTAIHSKNGLEVRMGATALVRGSHFSCNQNFGVFVWQHACADTVVGPDNVIQDNQGSGACLAARGIVFHHNKVTGNKLCGVTVKGDPAPGFEDVDVKVEDCEISSNDLGGVQFCGGTCGVISGCCIEKNNICGIEVGMDVEKLSITGNQIQGNYSSQETGIVMYGRATVADNNKFSNNRVTHEKAEELKTRIENVSRSCGHP